MFFDFIMPDGTRMADNEFHTGLYKKYMRVSYYKNTLLVFVIP